MDIYKIIMVKEHSPILFWTNHVGFLRAELTAGFSFEMWWPPAPICLCFSLKKPCFFSSLPLKIHTSWAVSQTTYIHRGSIHTWKWWNSLSHQCMHVCMAVCLHTHVHMNINVNLEPSLDGCIQQCVGAVLPGLPTLCAPLPNSAICDIIASGLRSATVGIFTLRKLTNPTRKSGAFCSQRAGC